jgi:thiol-disulfide isomerase/thioredoxin
MLTRAVKLHAARLEDLRQWFDSARTHILPGDSLLVFVTDHGGPARRGPGTGTISLWHQELTVREFRSLLDRLPPRVRVVTVMSQCYSGAFAELMYDRGTDQPSGNTCGFFSTSFEDKAYGCYPESEDHDRIGYAFEFIEALRHERTATEAHVQVVRSDDTPDKPRRTSDAYLWRLISDEAAARRVDPDELVDSLLAAAWRRGVVWEPELRLLDAIGHTFGTFSPRSLRELKSREDDLATQAEQSKTYSRRWNAALVEVQESLLSAFLAVNPAWRASLEPRSIDQFPPDERAVLLARFLDELYAYARQSDIWPKLERFREASSRGSNASWRFEVRKAAAERMRTILVAIAGRELLATEDRRSLPRDGAHPRAAQRQAFDALVRCEALEPGRLAVPAQAAPAAARASFPPLSDEIDLLQELQPSWLGVRYGPVAPARRQATPWLSASPQLRSVEEGSPAAAAGLQTGDVMLGPPGQPFTSSQQLLNWTTTSPRDSGLSMKVFRPGSGGTQDRELDVTLYLRPYPADRIGSGVPPRLGAPAPVLPDTLKSGRGGELPDFRGGPHLLFFWATWCSFCKAAVPEVIAFAAANGIPVLAITDEDQPTVATFLDGWTGPFFDWIALDALRKTFISYAVSGTPTIVMVDGKGKVSFRQVGYQVGKGLNVEGWDWRAP